MFNLHCFGVLILYGEKKERKLTGTCVKACGCQMNVKQTHEDFLLYAEINTRLQFVRPMAYTVF
jgi:hypothetical protein